MLGGEQTPNAELMAASTVIIIPVLALFFVCQRYFIRGIHLTGLAGR